MCSGTATRSDPDEKDRGKIEHIDNTDLITLCTQQRNIRIHFITLKRFLKNPASNSIL